MSMINVYHSKLKRSDNSYYRSECPFCKDGLFLVRRNEKTLELDNVDWCVSCGQVVVYKDIDDMKKSLG
jgi:hypothetical protein